MAAFAADVPGIAVGATRAAFAGLPTNQVFVGLVRRGVSQEVVRWPTFWDAFDRFEYEGRAPEPTAEDLDPDGPQTERDRYFAYLGTIAAYAFCWRYAERVAAGEPVPLLRDVTPPDGARVDAAAAALEASQTGRGRSHRRTLAAARAEVAAATIRPATLPPLAVRERAAWLGVALADIVCSDALK